MRNNISVIVITKDEEVMIADCLDSVSFCDEIIVVDNGSEDRTVDVAKRMGATVFSFKSNDFSKMRNYGLSKAKGTWILYVDADERVTELLRDNIKYQISSIRQAQDKNIKNRNIAAFKIQRKNFYLGSEEKNEWPYIERLERLFKKESLMRWKGELHETPLIEGEMGQLNGFLLHYTHRDLTSMLEKTIKWSQIEAELRFKAGHPKMTWWRFPRVMLTTFFTYYCRQRGWKKGTVGLVESIYQSFSMFITYARLWEMQNKSQN